MIFMRKIFKRLILLIILLFAIVLIVLGVKGNLIELNEKEESSLFFDTTKVSLDCTKCKGDLEQVSEGNVIKFYFFKYNVDGETVKIERIVK